MGDFYLEKQLHDLHAAAGPTEFLERFQARTALQPMDLVGGYVAGGPAFPLVLGGSIPAGLGSPVSDIDLLAVLDDIERFIPPAPNDQTLVVQGEPGSPLRAFVVHVVGGLEVDVAVVDCAALLARLDDALSAGGVLSRDQRRLFGRLVSGWILSGPEDGALARLARLRPAVEVRVAVSAYVDALKQLEDAEAAADIDPLLALHLSRLAVEAGFSAHLATEGVLDAGDKWLRALGSRAGDVAALSDDRRRLAAVGVPLLFPAADASAARQVADCKAFLAAVRASASRERRFAIAFALCPQVRDA